MRLNKNVDKPRDMPKLESPFVRKYVNDAYVCVPKITKGYEWVFTEKSMAVEKLDGTNVSIIVQNGNVEKIYNRKNEIDMWKKRNTRFLEGIINAIDKGYAEVEKWENGQYFGELVGPKINGNPYKLDKHVWLPFEYVKHKFRFKFWDEYVKDLENKDEEYIYNKISDLFKGLWSLYKRKLGIKGDVDEKTPFSGAAAEGIIFYNIENGRMAKLRRDMFDWFVGRRHEN